ncbi:MAG: peptidoglycan DD-metalloendopeptidase family protein, partial [Alphaproteobacteria bacterium]|nr:peptidoglycan DD-metalloendopeptidase family protein [Alphaproteobacteria bacterium]
KDAINLVEVINDEWENPNDNPRDWGAVFKDVARGFQEGWRCMLSPRGTEGYHCGIDKNGAEAETDGTVVFVRKAGKDANTYIVVRKENGKLAVYLHLKTTSITVKEGDKVKKGQVLGEPVPVGGSPTHTHYVVMKSENLPKDVKEEVSGAYDRWEKANFDPDATLADIVANRPGLQNEILYSKKYVFVAKWLRSKGARESIRKIITQRTFDINDNLIKQAVAAWNLSQTPIKLKPGHINPNTNKVALYAQMSRLEPALGLLSVAKEGVWERGYYDPDKDHVTGSVGIQNNTQRGPIKVNEIVPGFDGVFGLTDDEKKYAYEDVMHKYHTEFYPLIMNRVTRECTDGQMLVLADMFFQHGDWTRNKDGTQTGLIKLINDPNSTDEQIIAEMSKWRYAKDDKGKTIMAGGSVLRRGFLSALWIGDILPRELLVMESSALYNAAADLNTYIFWEGSKKEVADIAAGKTLKYKFDRQLWETIKGYEYPDREGAFTKGQGKKLAKGGNIDRNYNLVPDWVAREISKTKSGLPMPDAARDAYLQSLVDEGAEVAQPRYVRTVDDKNMDKAAIYADIAVKKLDKFIKQGEREKWWNKIVGSTRDAIAKDARSALELDPDNGLAKMVLVWEARASGQDSLAIALAQEIVETPDFSVPNDSVANLVMARTELYVGQSYERMGFPWMAYNNYSAAFGREPSLNLSDKIDKMFAESQVTPWQLRKADSLRVENLQDNAMEEIGDFISGGDFDKHAPQHQVSAYVSLADIHAGKKEYKLAHANYKRAFDLSNDPKYLYLAAENAMLAKEYEQAAGYARIVIFGNYYMDAPKDKARFWAIAGRAREAQGNMGDASINFTNANKLDSPVYFDDVKRVGAAKPAEPAQKPAEPKKATPSMSGQELYKKVKSTMDSKSNKNKYDDIINLLGKDGSAIPNSKLNANSQAELYFWLGQSLESNAIKKKAKYQD